MSMSATAPSTATMRAGTEMHISAPPCSRRPELLVPKRVRDVSGGEGDGARQGRDGGADPPGERSPEAEAPSTDDHDLTDQGSATQHVGETDDLGHGQRMR